MKLVWDKIPTPTNARNSEGSFIRLPDGGILFAYSRFNTANNEDAAGCDIAAIYSYDEGESWSEPRIIVKASDFGVQNIMSVSAVYQKDGKIGLYFGIKDTDPSRKGLTKARALSVDGKEFVAERIPINAQIGYYVLNNDRVIRTSDGRLCFPLAYHGGSEPFQQFAVSVVFFSDDDGATFYPTPVRLTVSALKERDKGMQEPGIIEHLDGTMHLWARTSRGVQYESYSRDFFQSATEPAPSIFTSPASPLEIARDPKTNDLYAVYNPIPQYYPRTIDNGPSWGRTPLVVRKSTDDGRTWGNLNVIEKEKDRGYCYPSMFFTEDNAMLCAYCRGGEEDGSCLARLGIMKISLDEIQK